MACDSSLACNDPLLGPNSARGSAPVPERSVTMSTGPCMCRSRCPFDVELVGKCPDVIVDALVPFAACGRVGRCRAVQRVVLRTDGDTGWIVRVDQLEMRAKVFSESTRRVDALVDAPGDERAPRRRCSTSTPHRCRSTDVASYCRLRLVRESPRFVHAFCNTGARTSATNARAWSPVRFEDTRSHWLQGNRAPRPDEDINLTPSELESGGQSVWYVPASKWATHLSSAYGSRPGVSALRARRWVQLERWSAPRSSPSASWKSAERGDAGGRRALDEASIAAQAGPDLDGVRRCG